MHQRSLTERFWPKVNKSGPVPAQCPELGPCWVWLGDRNEHGYGRLSRRAGIGGNDGGYAHRISWALHRGPIPVGKKVLHRCDNPACCNPAHLCVGTQRDNTDDRDAKDRVRHGSAHAYAKLTEEQVRRLRTLYATDAISLRALATVFGVSHQTVYEAIHGKTWRRV